MFQKLLKFWKFLETLFTENARSYFWWEIWILMLLANYNIGLGYFNQKSEICKNIQHIFGLLRMHSFFCSGKNWRRDMQNLGEFICIIFCFTSWISYRVQIINLIYLNLLKLVYFSSKTRAAGFWVKNGNFRGNLKKNYDKCSIILRVAFSFFVLTKICKHKALKLLNVSWKLHFFIKPS